MRSPADWRDGVEDDISLATFCVEMCGEEEEVDDDCWDKIIIPLFANLDLVIGNVNARQSDDLEVKLWKVENKSI